MIFVIILSTIVATLRFFITPRLNLPTWEGSYEAFSHLWVGGLIGAVVSMLVNAKRPQTTKEKEYYLGQIGIMFVAALFLSLLELLCFLFQKFVS